jgi:hypothetical protein
LAGVLDKFESQVEALDLQEQSMTSMAPEDEQIDQLLQQMIQSEEDSPALSQLDQLNQLQVPTADLYTTNKTKATPNKDTNDDMLEKRLQALRG